MFYASDGTGVSMSFKLEFSCSNNEVECFAYRANLFLVDEIPRLSGRENSMLIIKQVNRKFTLKRLLLYLSNCCLEVDQIFLQYLVRACAH